MMTIDELQVEHKEWADRNFGPRTLRQTAMGVVEEVGEFFHATLKSEQNIRGTVEEHEAAKRDAIGDIAIYAVDCATQLGVKVSELLSLGGMRSLDDCDDVSVSTSRWTPMALLVVASAELFDRSESQDENACLTDLADVFEALARLARSRGESLAEIHLETWNRVKQRDWTKDRTHGGEG